MMKYDPDKHHRRSIRLKGYDYGSPGTYFVTICVNARLCLWGEIAQAQVHLNDAGAMVFLWWKELEKKFSSITLDQWILMPNHLHGLITINNVPERTDLAHIVGWFKTMTTNEYIRGVKEKGWQPFEKHLWQRNYYERIVRSSEELNNVRTYITNNPANWANDQENMGFP